RSHIQPSISSYIPQTIQQPFLQTTNQQVIPTYTPSAIQQPFTHTNIQETQQPISTLTRPIIRKPRSLSVPPVIQQPF
ncbi:unnamed protein product, partial [Rotaria sp. Silwood1]